MTLPDFWPASQATLAALAKARVELRLERGERMQKQQAQVHGCEQVTSSSCGTRTLGSIFKEC